MTFDWTPEDEWLLGLMVSILLVLLGIIAVHVYWYPLKASALLGICVGFLVVPWAIGRATRKMWRWKSDG